MTARHPHPWINMGDFPKLIDIPKAEAHYAAKSGGEVKFLGQMTVKTRNGWSEEPRMIFWQEKPPQPEFSNYFGLVADHRGTMYICDGSSVAEGTWTGLMHPVTGEVIFSRWRHDFRGFSTKDPRGDEFEGFIDGGRDYTRRGGDGIPVDLAVQGPKMVILPEESA